MQRAMALQDLGLGNVKCVRTLSKTDHHRSASPASEHRHHHQHFHFTLLCIVRVYSNACVLSALTCLYCAFCHRPHSLTPFFTRTDRTVYFVQRDTMRKSSTNRNTSSTNEIRFASRTSAHERRAFCWGIRHTTPDFGRRGRAKR